MKRITAMILVLALALWAAAQDKEFKRYGGGSPARQALEGKKPKPLTGDWLNTKGKPLTWKTLKGKVVLLDFWAHW